MINRRPGPRECRHGPVTSLRRLTSRRGQLGRDRGRRRPRWSLRRNEGATRRPKHQLVSARHVLRCQRVRSRTHSRRPQFTQRPRGPDLQLGPVRTTSRQLTALLLAPRRRRVGEAEADDRDPAPTQHELTSDRAATCDLPPSDPRILRPTHQETILLEHRLHHLHPGGDHDLLHVDAYVHQHVHQRQPGRDLPRPVLVYERSCCDSLVPSAVPFFFQQPILLVGHTKESPTSTSTVHGTISRRGTC